MGLSDNGTFLIACLVETLAYGIALDLFVRSMMTLLRKKKDNQTLNIPIFIAAPILFLLSTIHLLGVMVRTYKAFVTYPEGPMAYWGLLTTPEKTVTQAALVPAIILGDLMAVYRTLMIWAMDFRIIIIPSLTLIATIVSGIGLIVVQHQVNVHTSLFATDVARWIQIWLACSLVTTCYCTAAIMYELISLQLTLNGEGPIYSSSRSLVSRALRILIESAALYSLNNLLYIVLYSTDSLAEAWLSGLDAPIASTTFSLIIVRLELAVNTPTTRVLSPPPSIPTMNGIAEPKSQSTSSTMTV